MLLWYAGLSVLAVFHVFRSAGLDFRLVALGSLLPLAVDLPFGHLAVGHTLVLTSAGLAAVMLATVGRPRLVRRRLLCLPIGAFTGLVLSGAWMHTEVFWWPLAGTSFGDVALLPSPGAVVLMEAVGLVACWWAVGLFDLHEAGPRREFLRTGRLRAVPPAPPGAPGPGR